MENPYRAVVAQSKMDYVLDPEHPDNKGKARLFAALGYTRPGWQQLADDLRSQHLILDAEEVESTIHGRKFEIVGPLQGPTGSAIIKSIWIIRRDEDFPRFVTAYRW